MIRARAPLRLPLGGGGTDLPEYAARFGTHVVAATLDLWVEVSLDAPVSDDAVPIEPRALAAAAALLDTPPPRAAFSRCDGAHGTGLGSSGALFVALLLAMGRAADRRLEAHALGDLAYRLEREGLARPVGTQDPYAAALGGFVRLRAAPGDARPSVDRLSLSAESRRALESRLWLVDSAVRRDAGEVLRVQTARLAEDAAEALLGMRTIHALAQSVEGELRRDVPRLGPLFDRHWRAKRGVHERMTTNAIDVLYERGRAAGATGGKLVGAGGGGTLLFDVDEDHAAAFRATFQELGLATSRVRFDDRGAFVVGAG
jgi:D-glycero-alpha-D-manno-heptose-7-phosphate kinase